MSNSHQQNDEPNMGVNIACFIGAFLVSLLGPAVIIFALAGAQAILNKSRKGKAIGASALLGSALPLTFLIAKTMSR